MHLCPYSCLCASHKCGHPSEIISSTCHVSLLHLLICFFLLLVILFLCFLCWIFKAAWFPSSICLSFKWSYFVLMLCLFQQKKEKTERLAGDSPAKRKWEIYTASVFYILPLKSFCMDLITLICTIEPKWLIEAMFIDFLSWANLWLGNIKINVSSGWNMNARHWWSLSTVNWDLGYASTWQQKQATWKLVKFRK